MPPQYILLSLHEDLAKRGCTTSRNQSASSYHRSYSLSTTDPHNRRRRFLSYNGQRNDPSDQTITQITNATSATPAEEARYQHPIESMQSSSPPIDTSNHHTMGAKVNTAVQAAINAAPQPIRTQFTQQMQQMQQMERLEHGPQGPTGPPSPRGQWRKPKFNMSDLGFLAPLYDSKSVSNGGEPM